MISYFLCKCFWQWQNNCFFKNFISEPDFVHSIDHEDYVYFFFRESAVEYINCGKVNYSYVLYLIGLVIQSAVNRADPDDEYSAYESTYDSESVPNT